MVELLSGMLVVVLGLTDNRRTVATWTAVPMLTPSVFTTAVRLPAAVGTVENVTVKLVAVALVTLPTAHR